MKIKLKDYLREKYPYVLYPHKTKLSWKTVRATNRFLLMRKNLLEYLGRSEKDKTPEWVFFIFIFDVFKNRMKKSIISPQISGLKLED